MSPEPSTALVPGTGAHVIPGSTGRWHGRTPRRGHRAVVAQTLWRAHRAATGLCHAGAPSHRWRCSPVSGFAAARDRWTMHALTMLPGAHDLDKESDA
ncbi:hypothetical protein DFP74_4162 [Nocardiopsis sp. Huas11]|uniref:hypothetical protein n=1 Tax=Nocardiopsis sp. Huas11 TaxID=2183912 RepID=UPI000F1E5477|nr:hypothetical protein [Nocardiopsis sp. Huas11]RKS08464.1 hypothetical protein DFP74_4162 [Nocardiopsis sp. Huas11]